jgi:signal transduction histidine kinase
VCALTRRDMAMRRVAVELDLETNLPPVTVDRIQLQQVILNLMVNGADAMDRVPQGNRKLTVRSHPDGNDAVLIAVEDAGVGLDPSAAAHIFEALFTTKPGGMGMGLAISQSIIQSHGGKIWATPNAGRGSVFQFTLPREIAP